MKKKTLERAGLAALLLFFVQYVILYQKGFAQLLLETGFIGAIGYGVWKTAKSDLARKIRTDETFRYEILLTWSLMLTLVHAGSNLYAGFRQPSLWFCLLGSYYALLFLARMELEKALHHANKERKAVHKTAKFLLLTDAIFSILCLFVFQGKGRFQYRDATLKFTILYVLCETAMASFQLRKDRKQGRLIEAGIHTVSLTAVLVSAFTLVTLYATKPIILILAGTMTSAIILFLARRLMQKSEKRIASTS